MVITKNDPRQGNLLDGTVIAFQPIPQAGAYVTVAGRDGRPTIVAFDLEDLAAIYRATDAAHTAPVDAALEDLARITEAGMTLLPEVLDLDRTDGAR
ncbi:hypothetical protein [Tsukamurella tyrosinosolvens]|uniref:hypothetical protein n=1 Tax=Tsukamurella tyrosinosolvens TaxID=57704 RepID=UPI000DF68E01|nr:hypothetical protein [Tsukamurella tyrosinosolvens]RDB49351.1 hypothetical protein DVB87_03210 [Tsukamurella tyrosinosolvens]